jgi:hypothetical protein
MTTFARSALAGGQLLSSWLRARPSEIMSFKADLKGASEIPPTTSQGTGNVTATYDTTSKKLAWKGTVSDLSGNATAAHFRGPAENGKRQACLYLPPASPPAPSRARPR